jgi:hypothetical protein
MSTAFYSWWVYERLYLEEAGVVEVGTAEDRDDSRDDVDDDVADVDDIPTTVAVLAVA